MARRRRRNPGGVMAWASAHPWLTVLFVLPTVAWLPIALIRAIRPPQGDHGSARDVVDGTQLTDTNGLNAGFAGNVVVDATPMNELGTMWHGTVAGYLGPDQTVHPFGGGNDARPVQFPSSAILRRLG